jgi:putative endonuclease
MRAKDATGAYGERLAAVYLERVGMTVLERNWRCSDGEIDLIASDGDVIVFCEVKTRSGLAFGHPAEAVVRAKASRLRRLAVRWLAEHDSHWREVRFDVVGVLRPPNGDAPSVTHLRGAF